MSNIVRGATSLNFYNKLFEFQVTFYDLSNIVLSYNKIENDLKFFNTEYEETVLKVRIC